MGRFNEGNVFTNTKCVGCNVCKSVCPSLGANVSEVTEGKRKVSVSKHCIECGACVSACAHRAREFRDDHEAFFEDLIKGDRISILVDPAFYLDYGENAFRILGYLKSMGVENIYDVSYGADISAYMHAKYVKEHTGKRKQCRSFIANNCASVVNFAERLNPSLIPLIVPVHSPVDCTAIYVKKYIGDNTKLAFISPCISRMTRKKGNEENLISYDVTFSGLMNYYRKHQYACAAARAILFSDGPGNIVGYKNGFIDFLSLFFDKGETLTAYYGFDNDSMQALNAVVMSEKLRHPLLATVNACPNGCMYGNGARRKDIEAINVLDMYTKLRRLFFRLPVGVESGDAYYRYMADKFSDLDTEDFICTFKDKYRQSYAVPDDVINDIFISMHKDTEAKKNINCRSCGYRGCREMAVAVASGYARVQDCVHYMNDDYKVTALKDRMTGLYNQMGFRQKATEILNDNPDKEYVLYVGNVNRLKNINDLYGVDIGDKVICHVAKWLYNFVGTKGIVSRYGGGAFALIFEYDADMVKAYESLENIDLKSLGVYFPITMRHGVVRLKGDSISISDAINLCSYAAEKVTDRTRNITIEYDDTMHREMEVETEITLKMRDAMDNGEFVLFLQPQYDHRTGKIVGAEALSRWLKSDGSIVSPGLFIPVFEKNGFIKDMDKYVWESAFKLIKSWEDSGDILVPISVNISRISLETDEIIDVIAGLYEKYPINKKHLYFEITESAYMKDQVQLTERIAKIRALGFEIAMDDFGSGYSSLNSLKDIPLDVLKLDMGFLRGGTNLERGNQIVAHVLHMAKALNLKIVGEGVETLDQADFLTEKGCDVIQGFYYAKPMPVHEYKEKLKKDI